MATCRSRAAVEARSRGIPESGDRRESTNIAYLMIWFIAGSDGVLTGHTELVVVPIEAGNDSATARHYALACGALRRGWSAMAGGGLAAARSARASMTSVNFFRPVEATIGRLVSAIMGHA
jgi:hypothetical protein